MQVFHFFLRLSLFQKLSLWMTNWQQIGFTVAYFVLSSFITTSLDLKNLAAGLFGAVVMAVEAMPHSLNETQTVGKERREEWNWGVNSWIKEWAGCQIVWQHTGRLLSISKHLALILSLEDDEEKASATLSALQKNSLAHIDAGSMTSRQQVPVGVDRGSSQQSLKCDALDVNDMKYVTWLFESMTSIQGHKLSVRCLVTVEANWFPYPARSWS